MTSFNGNDLLNYYINFGEHPQDFLRPIFVNAVHKSISTLTINDLENFNDFQLSQIITATISAVVSPIVSMSVTVAVDAFSSDYENRTATVEMAQLQQQNTTLMSLYSTLKQMSSSGDFIYRTQQAFIQINASASNRTLYELTNLNNTLNMLAVTSPFNSTVGYPLLYQMMISGNQSYYQGQLMPNYVKYGTL